MLADTQTVEAAETTIPVLATRVEAITPAMSLDDVCGIIMAMNYIKERMRLVESTMKERLIKHIETNGPIVIGTMKYYVGDEKYENDKNVRDTLEAVIESCAGDMDAIAQCLSKNAFKPATTRKQLGLEKFKKLFDCGTNKKLKSDGTPQKQLQVTDTRFVK